MPTSSAPAACSRAGRSTLPAKLAGTTSRFITALAALGGGPFTIDGGPPLRSRPMGPLHDALVALGADGRARRGVGTPAGHRVAARSAARTRSMMPRRRRSQYITALMLIAPLHPRRARIVAVDPAGVAPVPGDHRGGDGGVRCDRRRDRRPADRGPARRVRADASSVVEPDAISASYPLAAAAMVGGACACGASAPSRVQGDARFADVLGVDGVLGRPCGSRHRRDAPPRHPLRDRHRHGRHVRPGPHARRRRHAGGHADADHRRRLHPRARRATASATSPPSSARPGPTSDVRGRRDPHPPDRPAQRRHARHPPRPPLGDGVRRCSASCVDGIEVADPDVVVEELARRSGTCSSRSRHVAS